jgi:hypothetical protein
MLFLNARYPNALLNDPVVFEAKAKLPNAEDLLVVLFCKDEYPNAQLPVPMALALKDKVPKAQFPEPEVFNLNDL